MLFNILENASHNVGVGNGDGSVEILRDHAGGGSFHGTYGSRRIAPIIVTLHLTGNDRVGREGNRSSSRKTVRI